MMIAKATRANGVEILILGLSRANVNLLLAGKPIGMKPETHPGIPDGMEICIMFGETELAMKDTLMASAAITPDTKIIVDPRLNE